MKKIVVAPLLITALFLTGCSAQNAEDTNGTLPETSAPAPTESTVDPNEALEEVTQAIENDVVDIVQRSLTDFNSFNRTIDTTVAAIDSDGIAQIETGAFGDSIKIFDPERAKGKRALTVYFPDEPSPTVLIDSEDILSGARTFNGFYRIDLLINELDAIKSILDFDLSSPDGTTSAADYERMTTQNGFAFRSPAMEVDVVVTVEDGRVVKIVDTYDEGVITYEFDYDIAKYGKYFDIAN